MPRTAKVREDRIRATVAQLPSRVQTSTQVAELLDEHRLDWELAPSLSPQDFIQRLGRQGLLETVKLVSSDYKDLTRYVWGKASPYEVALSVKKGAFISHGTAAFLHDLTDQLPHTIFVNAEQSPKPAGKAILTQEGINRAFKGQQRTSNLIYKLGEWRITVVAGKNTGRMEVGTLRGPDEEPLEATKLERTLIDLAVRPVYGGGPASVLEAFRRAKDRVSTNTLLAVLKKFGYVYPYHQVIGFYMDRAEYPRDRVERIASLPMDFDFYLTYAMKNPAYVKEWRLYVPRSL
jgi:predicted transcriptional regulator of viral defense system